MSKAATSVFVFSIYMFGLGLILLFAPNLLLRLFGIPETSEVWIRVVSMLVLILGAYYFQAARNELDAFFKISVAGRLAVLAFFVVFVFTGIAPTALIIFGLVDFAAAIWTALSLRSDNALASTD